MGNDTNRSRRRVTYVAAVMAFIGSGAASAACQDDTVFLRGDWGAARFNVEIADDAREQAEGLMHRPQMATSAGMLFIYAKPQRTSFWMRNTLIPLDMLFLDQDGMVQHIHHNAIPLDETPIPGGNGVVAVLEINGGLARRMGITVASEMRHPSFANG